MPVDPELLWRSWFQNTDSLRTTAFIRLPFHKPNCLPRVSVKTPYFSRYSHSFFMGISDGIIFFSWSGFGRIDETNLPKASLILSIGFDKPSLGSSESIDGLGVEGVMLCDGFSVMILYYNSYIIPYLMYFWQIIFPILCKLDEKSYNPFCNHYSLLYVQKNESSKNKKTYYWFSCSYYYR